MCLYKRSWHIHCLSAKKRRVCPAEIYSYPWSSSTLMPVLGFHFPLLGGCSNFLSEIKKRRWKPALCGVELGLVSFLFATSLPVWAWLSISKEQQKGCYLIECSEDAAECRSVSLLGTDGSEPLAIARSFFAYQIANGSLDITNLKNSADTSICSMAPGTSRLEMLQETLAWAPQPQCTFLLWQEYGMFFTKAKDSCNVLGHRER